MIKLKNKYQRMSKEEKKKVRDEYTNTSKGKEMMKRLNRLFVIGILCFVCLLYFAIDPFIQKRDYAIMDIAILVPLFLCGVLFVYNSVAIRQKEYNKWALQKK